MQNTIQQIALGKLVAHPDNPNKMSVSTFAKLVRNIERTGRYEPLIVRPYRRRKGRFQIINGHHRCKALKKLGKRSADAIVWDVDDEQTDILLATLNRLSGSDVLARKIALLKRLTDKMNARQLGKLLPQTPGQIKRLIDLKMPKAPAAARGFANPLVFFVSDRQKGIIEAALSHAGQPGVLTPAKGVVTPAKAGGQKPFEQVDSCLGSNDNGGSDDRGGRNNKPTKAAKNAAALMTIAEHFLEATRRENDYNED